MVSSGFEAAVDAIVNGDAEALKRLLSEQPELIRTRSQRKHAATLLHYVAANGVENERQKTPPNIAEITEILLRAGADIEATADVYGGGCTTLGLAATSIHPQRAGVMEPLLSALLKHGARIDPLLVDACLANGRGEAAEFLATRGAPVNFSAAAGLGHIEAVKSSFQSANWEEREQGFLYACQFGRNDVVEFLLEAGVGIGVRDNNGQTGLHWAAIGRHLDTVKLLLAHNPPLDAQNAYGGTALGQAMWSADHGGNPESYSAIIETLVAAGIQC
jgi:ankyrin repeat protein